ncbi:MAG: helix-turn-helix domain-containing protein [Bacteroidota bacterium]|nr:helix-turn-helix domain-containing protein [Bacteroidota bacterium]
MEALIYIGTAQSLFAAFTIWSLKRKHLGNRILIAWLLMIALSMIMEIAKLNIPNLQYSSLGISTILIYGPFLLLYVNAMTNEKPTFSKKDLFHFVPFLIFSIFFTLFEAQLYQGPSGFFHNDRYLIQRSIFSASVLGSLVTYNVLIKKKLIAHRNHLKEQYSFSSEKITLFWLFTISQLFSTGWAIMILVGIIWGAESNHITKYIYLTINVLFSYLISIWGIRQPIIFDPEKEAYIPAWVKKRYPELLEENVKTNPKYEKSGLKSDIADQYVQSLLTYMEEEKAYLNGELSIQDLSDELGIPKHYLTQIINENLKKNFYTFVNEYRINAVKKMLADPKNENLTLLAVAFDCGFNSKSSFNNIFKQITGLTPTEYKRTIKE